MKWAMAADDKLLVGSCSQPGSLLHAACHTTSGLVWWLQMMAPGAPAHTRRTPAAHSQKMLQSMHLAGAWWMVFIQRYTLL
jgi:hypothetical protein